VVAECKEILVSMVKILESKVIEIIKYPEPELKVDKPD